MGEAILNIEKALTSGIPWSLIFLVSAALGVSDYLVADGMGIVPTIVSVLTPIMAGKSAITVAIIFLLLGLVMTNFINDVVTITVLYPIAAQFILNAGGDVTLFVCLFVSATIQGCFMPSGSVAGAMMHGNAGWLQGKDVFKYVAIMEIVLCVVLIIVMRIGLMVGV